MRSHVKKSASIYNHCFILFT